MFCVYESGDWNQTPRSIEKLHYEELRDLYSLPSIIRTIKSRRMRWAGHVARMGEKRNTYRSLVRKQEGKRPLRRLRLGGRIILGWILEKWDGVMCTGLVWLRIWTGGELLWIRYWTFGFHEMLGNYRVASRVVLSSI
jgi:hypothetical protein